MGLDDVRKQLDLFDAVRDDELLDKMSPLFGEKMLDRLRGALAIYCLDDVEIYCVMDMVTRYAYERLRMGFVLGCWYGGVRVD